MIVMSAALLLGACNVRVSMPGYEQDRTVEENTDTGRRDVAIDSAEFKELQKKLYSANCLDELLTHHSSVIYDMTDKPDRTGRTRDYFYITPDVCYNESPVGAKYSFGRYFYYLNYDVDGNASNMKYGVDLRSDYDILLSEGYQFAPRDNEKAWTDPEGEEHVSCYFEDGLVYFMDRRNPELSREWFEYYMPTEEYDGQTVYSEVIADADTMEINEFYFCVESADGAMSIPVREKAYYDQPEPRQVCNMRNSFERYCENMITATFTVDPGTDREMSASMTIPVGSLVTYITDNMDRAIMFDDAEATTLTHWDGMRDKGSYIFTDPTDEQIQRYNELVEKIRAELAGN